MKKKFEKYIPNGKFVLNVFKGDLMEIKKNIPVLIVVIGLAIIPSLYAWFNIVAFWDPYSNTKNLNVAVVNNDKVYEYKNQKLKFGDKVEANLKDNNKLDWQFVNMKKAKQGLVSGKYFAIIEIPNDFSKNLASLATVNVKKANINYYVNEKTNAIAPKITDSAVNTIKNSISSNFIENVANISLTSLGVASNSISEVNPKLDEVKNGLKNIDKQLDSIEKITKNANTNIDELNKLLDENNRMLPQIQKTLNDSNNLTKDIKNTLNTANNSFKDIAPNMRRDLESISTMINQSNDIIQGISNDSLAVNDDLINILNRFKSKLNNAENINNSLIAVLKRINVINSPLLNNAITRLEGINSSIEENNKLVDDSISLINSGSKLPDYMLQNLKDKSNDLNSQIIDAINNFENEIQEPITQILGSSINVSDDINTVITNTDKMLPTFNKLINNATKINNSLNTTLKSTNVSIDVLRNQIKDSIKLIEKIQNNKDFKNFSKIIKSNVIDRIEMLKEPVVIKEVKENSIKNYGAAMTPFYSILASWVGCIILIAILSTSLGSKDRAIDEYFGKFILFLMLAIIQAMVISAGNFLMLGISAKHPFLFTLVLIYCSIVFITIIYTMVSVFGAVGKGIGVFLLVIQIGGSGGTFPVEMTPSFFRTINAIVPFTYGIEACREAIGGIYLPNLIHDLLILTLFMFIALLLAIFFKEPINRHAKPMKKMFNNSFLIGH